MNGNISSETVAIGFLKDLIDRNLILIDKLGSTGNIKSCKIHNLLRDLCLKEVQKDGFYHVIGRSQGINRQWRRVVIPRNTSKKKVCEGLQSMTCVRSIICENGKVPPCRNFGLLRILHAYKFRTFEDQSYKKFEYVNLRHLAVEVRNMSALFSSVALFWSLHTLIVSFPYYYEPVESVEIWKMPQLRHIEFPQARAFLPDPSDKDEDVVIMENLQILKGAFNDNYDCVSNIKSLSKLESLHVSCDRESRGAPYLHKLSFPHSLKSLSLEMNIEFEWEDVLEKIGSLPLLDKLKLWSGCFGTGKWEI